MKVAITTVQIPFVSGGAEELARNLKTALIQAGHEAEIVSMPFVDSPIHLLENHIIAARLMDIQNSWGGSIDLRIGLRFPAYYMPHTNKVIWALHQHRQAYELYNTEYSNLKDDETGREARRIVKNADQAYLPEAKRIYTISKNVSDRMSRFNHIASTPLYHPCPDMDEFYPGEYGDYILMPSRINVTKRQKLAVEALTKTKKKVQLWFLGKADHPLVKQEIDQIVKEYHMENRVRFLGFVNQEEKRRLYANARAVLFVPKDEDYGYITLEAMASSRAVITATDSGGPLEFVKNGQTGYVVEPKAEAIAEAMDELYESRSLAQKIGGAAFEHLKDMDITWDHVVKELTKR